MRARLEGTTVAGGAVSRKQLGRLLGIAALEHIDVHVQSVAWVVDHVEVEVRQNDHPPVIFSIERYQDHRPCFLSAGQLSLSYRGQSLDPAIEAAVKAVAPRAFASKTIEDLAGLIAADPDAGRAVEPVPAIPEQDQRAYDEVALLSTWGSPAVWTSFFATAEVARSQLDSLDFFNRCTFVQHCDLECLSVNPQVGAPLVPVVLYPWDDRVRRLDWPAEVGTTKERDRAEGPGMVTTDLDERDVITGRGPSILSAALEHLAQGPVGAMVFCSTTCVPVISGEDVDGAIRAYRDRFEVPLLELTTTPQSMQGVFRELLVNRRLEAESNAPPPEPHTINLVGFSEDPAQDELRELLSACGIHVNVSILPALSPEIVDALPEARLNVVHPNALWRGLFDQILFDSRIESISPPAPFGRQATVRWLEAVAAAVDRDPRQAIGHALNNQKERWSSLRSRATERTLGFIVRSRDARFLTDPSQTWGIPLIEMCLEMGFHVVVLVQGSTSETARARDLIVERKVEREGLRISGFEKRSELRDLLRRRPIQAIYSEHFFDRRLSELGLAGFSGQYFERGFAGAARTLRRLLEVCDLPFSRRYGQLMHHAAASRGLPTALGDEVSENKRTG